MLSFLQSVTPTHPQAGPHSVASIQWQKQHYRHNASGQIIQRLSDAVHPAIEARKPFTLRLEGARSNHYGPYHLTPVWDSASRALTLEISNDRLCTPDAEVIARITLSAHPIAQECAEYTHPQTSANRRVQTRMNGANTLRERLMEQNVTLSDSLAAALFDAIATISSLNEDGFAH